MSRRGLIDERQTESGELSVALPSSGSCYAAAAALRSLAAQLEKHKGRAFSRVRIERDARRIVFVLREEDEHGSNHHR